MTFRSFLFIGIGAIAVIHYSCLRRDCRKDPQTETNGIYFSLKNGVTGNDVYPPPASPMLAPDSVKLIDLKTNYSYELKIGLGPDQTSTLYSNQYRRTAGITDTLIFKFGNATPDTLVVFTGIVKGWRGDECPYVNDAGITKVMLRNQVLVETVYSEATFTIFK